MPSASGEGEVCVRCGHARQVPVNSTTKIVHAIRRKSVRVPCGEPTDHGWPCPCRSRFHAT